MEGSFTPVLSTIDLLAVIGNDTTLRRVASTNGGEFAGPCPFCQGVDRFRVQPNHPGGKGLWYCRGCGEERWHDAIDYVRRRDGLSFREACDRLGVIVQQARATTRRNPPKAKPTVKQEATLPTWDTAAALAVVEECEAALWADAGAKARKWLTARGLADDTLRHWRLGYSAGQEAHGLFVPRGIVIPCFVGKSLWYIKVRRPVPPLPGRKYKHVKGGRPALYGLDFLSGKDAVVICEGEFDAMLLWQEAGDLVDTVAVGSATNRPALPFLAHLAGATRWLVSLDNDADKAAAWWGRLSGRVRRVKPLQGNDLTDFHLAGGNLRRWVSYSLERLAMETQSFSERLDELDKVVHDHEARLTDLEADLEAGLLPRCQVCGRTVYGWPERGPGPGVVCLDCLIEGETEISRQ